eukprot:jgi/Orpsp1_1/1185041/evm.model.c7180000092093.1
MKKLLKVLLKKSLIKLLMNQTLVVYMQNYVNILMKNYQRSKNGLILKTLTITFSES